MRATLLTHAAGLVWMAMSLPACAQANDFSSLVSSAREGAVINAPPGLLQLRLQGKTFARPVTIRGGTFSKVEIISGGGVRFERSTFTRSDADAKPLVYLGNASNVFITDATFRGNGLANAVNLRTARQITVRNSYITSVANGIRSVNARDVNILNNRFFEIPLDSIGLGGASRVAIIGNRITASKTHRNPHPDAIQMWDNPENPSVDILIRGNYIDSYSQGIFIKSEDKGGFDRVNIEGNNVKTDYAHALTLTRSRNSRIADNVVRTRTGTLHMAKIMMELNRDLKVENNKVCKIVDRNNTFNGPLGIQIGWECPPGR